jgi:hypothetical protein
VRDWQALVRERFSGRGLTSAQQDEIVAELAAHLEDLFEEQSARGASETDAIRCALDEVADWRKLARKIRSSKEEEGQMNARTKSLWLPGLASLTAAMGALMIMDRLGVEPRVVWYSSTVSVQLYLPWLVLLPVFGALGACLSRRANGESKARLAAALFPALALLGVFCLGITAKAIEGSLPWRIMLFAFAVTTFDWVLLPAVLLLLGASPFLPRSAKWEAEQGNQMNNRTRRLWIPGFASLTAATGMLIALNRIGVEPSVFWHGTKFGMNLILPWLIAMPVFGGLGAYLSRLANGDLKTRLVSALFPVIVIFGVFCLSTAVSEVVWRVFPMAFAQSVFNWVLLPGVLLLLGALPFLRSSQKREVSELGEASC